MPDIVCLGEPLLEFNQQPDGRYLPGHGGDTSNCAIAAARQGASVGYITRIGDDAFGASFLSLWRAEGVDTREVVRDPAAHTGIYFVTHDERGHAFSYFRAGSAASLMQPGQVPEACIAGDVLRGIAKPDSCSAFGTECTPEHPLGAPMVSAEGACSAYYRYARGRKG